MSVPKRSDNGAITLWDSPSSNVPTELQSSDDDVSSASVLLGLVFHLVP